ncbi:MAG: glutamate--tRNA ligase family protein [Candidatus Kaiserbacteria bacterium]|nr:glutamate--tRNA ligase family protein [Candidatus Kaiserbacteria bacterium]
MKHTRHNDTSAHMPVTRIAPSPTGTLHIGTARAALFNYLFARCHGGKFILRFEDTDRERSEKLYEEDILTALQWLSLTPDIVVRQSDRKAVYQRHIQRLLTAGKAYLSKEPSKKDPAQEVEVVRFRNTSPVISFTDTVRGAITVDIGDLGDFVLARSVDDPLYHLAAVVDDMEMGVTHILRGDDHIINTPRQIALLEALGGTRPSYTHLPLIHSPSGGKLSKRKDATAVTAFRDLGYLPEAIVNAIALMGWSPKRDDEVFSLEELVATFSLSGIQKKEAVFNEKKLLWFQKQHLQRLSEYRLRKEVLPSLVERFPVRSRLQPRSVKTVLHAVREKGAPLAEERLLIAGGVYDFYFTEPTYATQLLLPPKSDMSPKDLPSAVLSGLWKTYALLRQMSAYTGWDEGHIQQQVWSHAEQQGKSLILWPLRVALSGQDKSPGPFLIAQAIGKRQTMRRIQRACALLEGIL